jgi:YVTN family beta-propeller protein
MTLRSVLPILLVSILALHCSKDNPVAPPPSSGAGAVYVLNEGNFQRGNATLSMLLPDSARVYADVFSVANGRGLGDTGNSLTEHDGRLYIVVNGSNRMEVVDVKTAKLVKTIACPAGASPRYIVFDASGTGYISNLYTNSVSVYDDASNTITAEIPVGQNPEQLLVANGRLFVTNSGFGNGRTVSVIDIGTKTVTGVLAVGDNPAAIAATGDSTAVVLCTGAYNDFNNPADDTPGTLFFINTKSARVTDSLPLGGHPQRIALDGAVTLYTVQPDGIQKVDLVSKTVTDAFIAGAFYSVAFDAGRNLLYVTDALDYVQPGKLLVYSPACVKIAEYTVGIIPGAMVVAR